MTSQAREPGNDPKVTPGADDHSADGHSADDHSADDHSDDHSADDHSADDHSADDHDWEWRRKIRANPQLHLIYRIVVGVVGLLVVILGLILVPFPGPGWLVVLLGLAILASEFKWAQRLLRIARETLQKWNDLLRPQPWWVKAIVLLLTVLLVMVVIWLLFVTSGVPGFFPESVQEWLAKLPGLES